MTNEELDELRAKSRWDSSNIDETWDEAHPAFRNAFLADAKRYREFDDAEGLVTMTQAELDAMVYVAVDAETNRCARIVQSFFCRDRANRRRDSGAEKEDVLICAAITATSGDRLGELIEGVMR